MSLGKTYDEKTRIVNDIFNKMSDDEKRIMLRLMIKENMKSFFETIWEEQKFLEKEAGIDGAELVEATECVDTSEKAWINGEEDATGDTYLSGKVSKESENAYYLDHKKKLGNDKFDGFLGYVNTSGADADNDETVYEPSIERRSENDI